MGDVHVHSGSEALTFRDYQNFCRTVAVYPGSGEGGTLQVIYCALGAASEAGEACGHVKKMIRDDGNVLSPDRRLAILRELGDTLWYVTRGAEEMGLSLEELAMMNVVKLSARKEAGTLHGGDEERVRYYESLLEDTETPQSRAGEGWGA